MASSRIQRHGSVQICGREVREFEQIFAAGRTGEPHGKTIDRIVALQKAYRKKRNDWNSGCENASGS